MKNLLIIAGMIFAYQIAISKTIEITPENREQAQVKINKEKEEEKSNIEYFFLKIHMEADSTYIDFCEKLLFSREKCWLEIGSKYAFDIQQDDVAGKSRSSFESPGRPIIGCCFENGEYRKKVYRPRIISNDLKKAIDIYLDAMVLTLEEKTCLREVLLGRAVIGKITRDGDLLSIETGY